MHPSDVRPEFLALGFLQEGELHGYDLYRRFESELGMVWRISQSQMYTLLKRLEGQAMIEGSLESQDGRPAKRVFRATAEGTRHFREWLEAPTDCSSRFMRLEFVARLYFGRKICPQDLPAMIDGQHSSIARHVANHERILSSLGQEDRFNILGLRLKLRQLRSIQAWLEEDVEGPQA